MFTNNMSKIFVVFVVIAVTLVTASFVTRSATIPAADRSYDNLEQLRALHSAVSSYDLIEQVRLDRSKIESKAMVLREYQLGERYGELPEGLASEKAAREYWLGERYGQTPNTDHSYDPIENLRLSR